MDICHLKNAEWETKHQNYNGRVVLRGDIVKDDSGSYEVFTEQGSSASQMTAANVMGIISRMPGCDGQAADTVSAYLQVKMEDASSTLLKIPKSEHPDIWIRLPKHEWPKSWEKNLYGHPLAFIIQVNINCIVMWETQHNNADWDCFKTPILQEILRIQNLHQVEQCAFSEAVRCSDQLDV